MTTILTTLMCAAAVLAQTTDKTVDGLIVKALQNPGDPQAVQRAIGAWNRAFDPRVIPSFRQLFGLVNEKRSRQLLAVTLLRHGVGDQMYFDELAWYAREAITTTAPYWFDKDAMGNDILDARSGRPHWNAAFLAWCEARSMKRKECLQVVIDFPVDVMLLVEAHDPRAIPVLREGLSATFAATVEMAVKGLGQLHDVESIPTIVVNLERFPPDRAQSIAEALVEFDDPRVGPLLDRFIRNAKLRQELDGKLRRKQSQ